MRSNLDCALTYASMGLQVFPCQRMSKFPITKNGFYNASSSVEEIKRMWTAGEDLNVAIRIPDDKVIVDIDDIEYAKTLGDLPETVTAMTARIGGGYHLWYQLPEGVSVKRNTKIINGIDVLPKDGYVLAPNSVHPNGHHYKWIKPPSKEMVLPPLPQWIIDALAAVKETEKREIDRKDHLDIKNILMGAEEGTRQTKLFLLACSLRGRGVLFEEALMLLNIAAMNAVPPYTEQPVEKILERVYSKYQPNEKQDIRSRKIWKVSDLIKEDFEEIQYFVEKLMIPGAILFSSDPKLGKSMILANIFKAIALGKKALGKFHTKQCGALYLDLEQGEDMGSKRWIKILGGDDPRELLDTCFTWDRMDQGGYTELDNYLKNNPHVRVVAIDTLARFMPVQDLVSGTAYNKDYAIMSKIADLARKHRAAIVCVHHNVKNKSEGDFIKNASGSMGLTAASDIIWGLDRTRNSDLATLRVTGKNIEEAIVRLGSYNDHFTWYAV